jgi:co-chaperonin GroES (HSP10)
MHSDYPILGQGTVLSNDWASVKNASIKPLHDLILVRKIEFNITESGIVIPSLARQEAYFGLVLEASDATRTTDGKLCPLMVHKGDTIMFAGEGIPITVNDEKLFFLRENEVFAILKPAQN